MASVNNKRINIVHLISGLGVGGAEKIVLGIHKAIDKKRFNSQINFWQDGAVLLKADERLDEKIIKLNLGHVNSPKTVLRVAGQLKNTQADVLQTHLIDADLLGFFAAKLLSIPHLITIHSYPFPLIRKHCLRYRFMASFTDRVICVSNTVKSYLIKHVNIPADKIAVVHNGIDLEEFSTKGNADRRSQLRESLGIEKDVTIVGNVSRLIEDKGHKYLLMAIPDILKAHPRTLFLIVGDGELKDSLMALGRELGIMRHVIFTGLRSDVSQLLDIMDLFVFPTFNEALGLCVLEAMAMGKPIIATNDAAVPELIDGGKEGLLVPPGNSQLLARAIVQLLEDPEKRESLGKAAAVRVREFSFDKMVRRIEDIYQETCLGTR